MSFIEEEYESLDEKFNVVPNENDAQFFNSKEMDNGQLQIKKENIKYEDISGDPKDLKRSTIKNHVKSIYKSSVVNGGN